MLSVAQQLRAYLYNESNLTVMAANTISKKLIAFIGSRSCFVAIMAVFVLEAAWVALSGRYPMAFDENFHLGIIRLYAHHLSPFWQVQPSGADVFGAVFRDPSYLYHYLMSFPYRFISLFTQDQTIQVIWLRFINIALFTASLPLYRRLLLKTGASKTIVQACLAIFILIPIAPLLAAQINYDNLLLPAAALTLLLAVNVSEELRLYKRINLCRLLQLTIVGLLTCLVKYAFLPILLVIAIFLAIRLRQTYSKSGKFWLSLGFGWTLMTKTSRWALVILVLLSIGLFTERYGLNTLRYHKPIPDCSKVLSAKQCSAYGPWVRDHQLEVHKPANATKSPLVFSADWFYGMWLRSFFAVDGPASNFATKGPLILPGIGAIAFAASAALVTLIYSRRLWKIYNSQVLWLFIGAMAGYVGILWLDGYQSFLQTGQAVAINGRYLLPILPLLLLLLVLGPNELLKRQQAAKLVLAIAALICMAWGGGTLTYILRSNDSWYWPNQTVQGTNRAVRNAIGPAVPGYYSPNEFMGRN